MQQFVLGYRGPYIGPTNTNHTKIKRQLQNLWEGGRQAGLREQGQQHSSITDAKYVEGRLKTFSGLDDHFYCVIWHLGDK